MKLNNQIVIGIVSVSDIESDASVCELGSDQKRFHTRSWQSQQQVCTRVPDLCTYRGGSAQKAYLFQASGIIMEGLEFHKLRCMKGKGNLNLGIPFFCSGGSRPWTKGGPCLGFLALLAFVPSVISSFFTQNKGGGGGRAPPLDPPLFWFSNVVEKLSLFYSLQPEWGDSATLS